MTLIITNIHDMRNHDSELRRNLKEHGKTWRKNGIPLLTVKLLGDEFMNAIEPHLHDKVDSQLAIQSIMETISFVYDEAMYFLSIPMLIDCNLIHSATQFYKEVSTELDWSDKELELRMIQIKSEIAYTRTYTQSAEEIEVGARLAWRNSSKCIGR